MLAVSRGWLVALSTPFGRRGFFHHEWQEGQNWQRIAIPATECPRIASDFLAEERMKMGEAAYNQEYMLEFRDAVDAVFSEAVIERALADGPEPLFG